MQRCNLLKRVPRCVLAVALACFLVFPSGASAAGFSAPFANDSASSSAPAASDDGAETFASDAAIASDDGSSGADSGTNPDKATDSSSDSGADSGSSANPSTDSDDYAVGLYLFYENPSDVNNPIPVDAAQPRIIDAVGSLQMYAQAENASGDIDWAGNLSIGVVWSIVETYDEDGNPTSNQIATVERSTGLVRALGQGNGSVKLRCQAADPFNGYTETEVQILGNSGVPYVEDLQICDSAGNIIPDDESTRLESGSFGLEQHFYVQVTYVDPVTGERSVKSTAAGDTIAGAHWSVSGDAGLCYVNPDTGVVVPQKTGTVTLSCSIAGAGKLGDTIEDTATLLLGGDTLDKDQNSAYDPAEYLTVVVKYAAEDKGNYATREDYDEARTWYYTSSDIESLGTTTNSYTLVKRDGDWDRMDAYGIYLQTLIDDQNLDLEDIEGFYFHATDNANTGFVSCNWVFNANRYYFPNIDMGTGLLDAKQVAPMLAIKTTQTSRGGGLSDIDPSQLSDQTRFRLCLGAESPTSNNASKSLYNVDKITIILTGAPPTHWDDPGNGTATKPGGDSPNPTPTPTPGGDDSPTPNPNPGGGDDPDPTPTPGGDDTPTPTPGGDDTPTPTPGGSDTPTPNPDANENNTNPTGPGTATPTETTAPTETSAPAATTNTQQSNQQAQSSDSASRSNESTSQNSQQSQSSTVNETNYSTAEQAAEQAHKTWQVYEMMRADDPNVEALDLDNPLVPWAVGALALTAAGAALTTAGRYRRNLMGTPALSASSK